MVAASGREATGARVETWLPDVPFLAPEVYAERSQTLDDWCVKEDRDPRAITRTIKPVHGRESDGRGAAIGEPAAWARFGADLERVLRDAVDVRELILARRRDVLRRPAYKGATPPPTRVEFDNVVSESHTVLDVRTADRLGLLYVISSVLNELRLDLSLAKITTEADQAVDVFYVTEPDGSKVAEGPRMEEIRRRLTEAISEGIG